MSTPTSPLTAIQFLFCLIFVAIAFGIYALIADRAMDEVEQAWRKYLKGDRR